MVESLTYTELAAELIPYVLDMGYTHIELLPVMEHPYSGSWGYQPLGVVCCDFQVLAARISLKLLLMRCHQADIGVMLDWVPAHFPEDGHGLGPV